MKAPRIRWIGSDEPPEAFPGIEEAFTEPDGLLAAGGDLSEARLVHAYRHGIFPWYEEGQPILWWSPDPRCILDPAEFHLSRRLRRTLRGSDCRVSFNEDFAGVMAGCAGRRRGQRGTWITADMRAAYQALHRSGWAHSVEIWDGDALAGGIYGLAIGQAFFGESMFSRQTNASKMAMLALIRQLLANDFAVLDCQVVSPHLLTLGAKQVPRTEFRSLLDASCTPPRRFDRWPDGRVPVRSIA